MRLYKASAFMLLSALLMPGLFGGGCFLQNSGSDMPGAGDSISGPLQISQPVLPEDPFDFLYPHGGTYRAFVPGVIRPEEGTIEITARIDKDIEQFGNDYDFLFAITPGQPDMGNNMLAAFIAPPQSRPDNNSYIQPLSFLMKTGGAGDSKTHYAHSAEHAFRYVKGEPFNLAFIWKVDDASGYLEMYLNGEKIAQSNFGARMMVEHCLDYQIRFTRGAPFNISNIKVSTAALTPDELEASTDAFSRGTHTALLADASRDEMAGGAYFQTPYHIEGAYSAARPLFQTSTSTYFTGQTVSYPILLLNNGENSASYAVSIQGKNQYGEEGFSVSESFTVPPSHTYAVEYVTLPVTAAGYYTLDAKLTGPSGDAEYTSALTVTPAPDTLPDGSFSGINGLHIDYSLDMAGFDPLNISITRTWAGARVFLWYVVEPERGRFEWEVTDDYVRRAADAGLDVLAVLGYPSEWASTRPEPAQLPDDISTAMMLYPGRYVSTDIRTREDGTLGGGELWRNYVYQVMKRYAGQVRYYEIVNEVNFHTGYTPASFTGTGEEYFLMQKIAYEQAQRVRQEYLDETGEELELYVTTSGFSATPQVTDQEMVLEALNEENLPYFDIFNIHGYQGAGGISEILKAYRAAKRIKPTLRLWQSEFIAASDPDDLTTAWKIYKTVENYMSFLRVGVDRYIHMGATSADEYITHSTRSPTQVFQAMSVLQQMLRGADEYLGLCGAEYKGEPLPVRDYFRRTDGNYLYVFAAEDAFSLMLQNPGDVLCAMDEYGTPAAADTGNVETRGNCLFVVSNEPLIFS